MIIHRKLHSTVMIVFSSILYLVVCRSMWFSILPYTLLLSFLLHIFSIFDSISSYFADIVLSNFIAHTSVPFLFSLPMNKIIRKIQLKIFPKISVGFNRIFRKNRFQPKNVNRNFGVKLTEEFGKKWHQN